MTGMNNIFAKFAAKVSHAMGSPYTFILAVTLIATWVVSGPIFKFSEVWQLFINTTTTIITFLMVFIIQNSQNRDAKSMELKLNELIHKTKSARNSLIDLEELSDKDLEKFQKEFRRLAEKKAVAKA